MFVLLLIKCDLDYLQIFTFSVELVCELNSCQAHVSHLPAAKFMNKTVRRAQQATISLLGQQGEALFMLPLRKVSRDSCSAASLNSWWLNSPERFLTVNVFYLPHYPLSISYKLIFDPLL